MKGLNMKGKLGVKVLCVLALFLGGLSATASIYKYDLFEVALKIERENAGLVSRELRMDGMKISYLISSGTAADKPTLVLVHGFGALKENWVRFATELREKYRIVALDLPGHGNSAKNLSGDYRIESQVAFLARFLDQLGMAKVHLAGNSMGGAIVSMFAARYPEKAASLVLFDPAGVFDFKAPFQDMLAAGVNPLIVRTETEFDYLIRFAMEKPPVIPWPFSVVLAEQTIAKADINQYIFTQLVSSEAEEFKVLLSKVSAPTLIIWGTEDRVIDVKNAQVFQRLMPNASVRMYDGIGHVPMLEVPSRSAQDVTEFIQSLL